MTRKNLLKSLFAAACLVGAVAPAQAGLLPVSVTVTPESGNFRWAYSIVLPTDMQLQSGNFFTIYDFDGYVAGSEMAPEGWAVTTSNVGPTPDRLTPVDSADVTNLTFTYNGPTIESGQVGLGNFMANSTFDAQQDSYLTARTRRTSDGLFDSNITGTLVPTGSMAPPPPMGVPEPATLALAALGLPVAALGRLVRRRRAA